MDCFPRRFARARNDGSGAEFPCVIASGPHHPRTLANPPPSLRAAESRAAIHFCQCDGWVVFKAGLLRSARNDESGGIWYVIASGGTPRGNPVFDAYCPVDFLIDNVFVFASLIGV
jgi:hypothetical protein